MKPFDPKSPSPLYHQIAESIRTRIAIGDLPAGVALPPLRAAAAEWGVNLHTVRHAYAELARQGLVSTEAPWGPGSWRWPGRLPISRSSWSAPSARDTIRFGLGPAELAAAIAAFPVADSAPLPAVRVVECSDAQCADLAEQLAARFAVDARPWCLHQDGEPPAGPIVATYFHYGEVRRRWPHRSADVSFASIHPDPGLVDQIRAMDLGTTLTVWERDPPTADAVAADLSVLFPSPRWTLLTRVRADRHAAVGPGPAAVPSPGLGDAVRRRPRAARRAARPVPVRRRRARHPRAAPRLGPQTRFGPMTLLLLLTAARADSGWTMTRLDLDLTVVPGSRTFRGTGSATLRLDGESSPGPVLGMNTRAPVLRFTAVTPAEGLTYTSDGPSRLARIDLPAPATRGDEVTVTFAWEGVADAPQLVVTDQVALGSWVEGWYPSPTDGSSRRLSGARPGPPASTSRSAGGRCRTGGSRTGSTRRTAPSTPGT